ncbi:hypothetical protein ELAK_15300 [Elizabethkingia anophelis]|nr:hypothetical protein ELAK_15300 [Elizabethkingia anophelis]
MLSFDSGKSAYFFCRYFSDEGLGFGRVKFLRLFFVKLPIIRDLARYLGAYTQRKTPSILRILIGVNVNKCLTVN